MSMLVSLMLSIGCAASPACCRSECGGDPFDAARFAPANITALVHVEGARELRRELAGRPLAKWLDDLVQTSALHEAWAEIAAAAGVEETLLFDLCFGERATLMMREPQQWAVITEMSGRRSGPLLRQLGGRVLDPRCGFAITELPEQAMLLARGGRVVVIGPSAHQQLFDDVLLRLGRERRGADELPDDRRQPSLVGSPAIARGQEMTRELGEGRIAFFIRHAPPLGGWSVAVADLKGDEILVNHAANFDNSPFGHDVTGLTCDFSPVTAFGDNMLVAIMQPMDVGDGPVETFVSATLREGLLSDDMRANLGERRVLLVGEQDGRELAEPADILTTTFVTCLELTEREPAVEHLDRQMLKLTRRINDLGKGTFLIELPGPACLARAAVREIDLEPAAKWLTGGFPIMKSVSLTWTVAEGPQGAWYVVGSNRRSLDDAVRTLAKPCPRDERFVGAFDSCGVGNGVRLSRHLRSWSDEAGEFTDPAHTEEVRGTLGTIAELVRGLERCEWQLARPSANEMLLRVQIKLTPPDSADDE